MTAPVLSIVQHDRDRALFSAITVAHTPAATCPDCGGELLADVTSGASGNGPGRAITVCRARREASPYLPDDRYHRLPCGAPSMIGRLWTAWREAGLAVEDVRADLARPTAAETDADRADRTARAMLAWYREMAARDRYIAALPMGVA